MKYVAVIAFYTRHDDEYNEHPHIIVYKVFPEEQAAWEYLCRADMEYYDETGNFLPAGHKDRGLVLSGVGEFDDNDHTMSIENQIRLAYDGKDAELRFDFEG